MKLLILTIFLFACSHNDNIVTDGPKEDLLKSFDLSKEEMSKYEVKEVKKAKPIVLKKRKKSISKKKKIDKKKKEKVELKPVVKKVKDSYPKDYPELFKKYDKDSKKVWAKSRPIYRPGEVFIFDVKYVGILAGHVRMETRPLVTVNNTVAFHYYTKLTSAKYYSFIYDLDDYIESFVEKESFLPIKYTLIQRESKQSVDDLEVFDHEKMKTYLFYKKIKEGKEKKEKKAAYIPKYFQDSFSALMFARSLPLKLGEEYRFPVVTRAKTWLLKFKAERKERVKVGGKYYKAIKVNAETHYPGVLKKRGDIYFWFSDDEKRILLKFQAKVKIGSVEGDLKKYIEP